MNKIKFLRNEAGLTTRELADLLNFNYSNISRLELNKNTGIKQNVLEMFCGFFMVEPNYLLGLSNEGILCKNALGQIVSLTEEEYLKLSNKYLISFNQRDGRFISKSGEDALSEMRSKDFDKNMLYIMQGISSNGTIKEIIPLLSQLNDSQLELILNTIKALLGK